MSRISPAADRNKDFIFAVLNEYLQPHARVLEIASGTGQHAAYITGQRPDLSWQCTDQNPEASDIQRFDIERDAIPFAEPFDVLVNINMIHISPWTACLALLEKTKHLLKPGGILYFYGPYLQADCETAASNLEFDRSLKSRNLAWGLRDRDTLVKEAARHGLAFLKKVDMPANNISLIFRASSAVCC